VIEDRVRRGLAGAADAYEASPGLRAAVDGKVRHHRRVRLVWGAVATLGVVVFAAGLGALFLTGDDGNENVSIAAPTVPDEWQEGQFVPDGPGLEFSHPASWRTLALPGEGFLCRTPQGIVITNGDVAPDIDIRHEGVPIDQEDLDDGLYGSFSCGGWRTWELPDDHVLVVLQGPQTFPPGPPSTTAMALDTNLPLDGASVTAVLPREDQLPVSLVADHQDAGTVELWVGPDASPADVATARRIVESLHPAD
jgi:hypothetical protein